MGKAIRICLSILAALTLAFACVVAVEFFGSVAHPFPAEFTGTQEEMWKHVERFPHWVLAIAAVAWIATTYASTWVATRFGNRFSGLAVGLLLLLALVFNVSQLPYPMWFKIGTLAAFPLAILAGIRTVNSPPNAPGNTNDR